MQQSIFSGHYRKLHVSIIPLVIPLKSNDKFIRLSYTLGMISVVIPAYNEEGVILSTIHELVNFLSSNVGLTENSFEIIVVDDGSQDTTAKKIDEAMQQYPMVKKISLEKNLGKGNAVRVGMLQSVGDYCLFIDADHSVSIENFQKFYEKRTDFDILIGSIYHSDVGYSVTDSNSFMRKFFRKMYRNIPRKLFQLEVNDTQRGFKFFSRKAVDLIFPVLKERGYVFDIEILVLAKKNKLAVAEVPVSWSNPYNPKINLLQYAKITFGIARVYIRHYIRL